MQKVTAMRNNRTSTSLHNFISREAASTGGLKKEIKLSPPRYKLLARIQAAGGSLLGARLTVPERRTASRMQSDGLVEWMPGANRRDLSTWTLKMAPPGAVALQMNSPR